MDHRKEIIAELLRAGRPELARAFMAEAANPVAALAKQALRQLKKDQDTAFRPSHEVMKKIRDAIKQNREEWRGDDVARSFMQEFDAWPDTLLSATDDIRDDDLIRALTSLAKG